MTYKRYIFIILIFITVLLFTKSLSAQTGTIRGFVYEKETGEPILFTNVYLYKTTYGAVTDVNGYFVISKAPTGSYTLMVTSIGFDTLKFPVNIKPDKIITKKFYLNKSNILLKGVSVSAEKQSFKTETKTSVVKITPKQIKQIPAIGGQPDFAQYLQVLPGIIFTGDQGGQLYIRGGSPIQNKVLLDGMIIYNPFHSIGLFSVFDTDILKNAEIYTGGFGAEYGGRISSIMDITTRDGNKKKITGKISAGTFGSKLLIEGPLKKQTDPDKGSSSFIFSAKNSYLEQSSKVFYKYINKEGLPFNYTDLYGKLSFNATNGSKANIFGFNFSDYVTGYNKLADFRWNSSGGGTNFLVIPPNSSALIQGNIAYSKYKISLEEESFLPRTSEINGFNMGLNFTYFYGKNELKYGIEMLGFKTVFNFFNSVNRKIDQTENTTELAGFIKTKIIKGKIILEPSFRAHYYASLSELSPEPRLSAKLNISDDLRIKFATGLYSQNLISSRSDRDVVNLFYGFLSGPENLQTEFDGKDVKSKLQKAQHIIFGIEYDLFKHSTINIEGYYKNFSQLTNMNRNKVFDDTPEYSDIPDYLKKDFIIESGNAQGIDVSVKYDYRRLYVWAVYSLGYIHKYDEISDYVPHYDRRHNVNLVGSYIMGKNLNWEFDVRWNMGSGFPFTLTQGFYELLDFSGGINTDYTTINGYIGTLYDDLNKGRLPYYHRLDVSLKRKFELGKNSTLEINISITNVYNRKNVFYVDRITNERIDQLPVMPSAGLSLTF